MRFIICFLLMVQSSFLQAERGSGRYRTLNQALFEKVILPANEGFRVACLHLSEVALAYAADPSSQPQAVRQGFHKAVAAWQRIQWLRSGPAMNGMRYEKIYFWPDKRGGLSKALRRVLAKKDQNLLDPQVLVKHNAALQGLPAIERLIWAEDGDPEGDWYRRRLLGSVAQVLASRAHGLSDGWRQYYEDYVTVGGSGSVQLSQKDLTGLWLMDFYSQLQLMEEEKIAAPLGSVASKSRASKVEFWRSGSGLSNLRENTLELQRVFSHAWAPALTDQQLVLMWQSEWQLLSKRLKVLRSPMSGNLIDQSQRQQWQLVRSSLTALRTFISTKMSEDLQLYLGFNSLDGD